MAGQKGGNLFTLIGLILAIFVILIMVFLTYQMNADNEALALKVRAAQDETEEAREQFKKVSAELQGVNELVHGRNTGVDVAVLRANYLARAHTTIKEVLQQEQFGGVSETFSNELHSKGRIDDKPFTHIEQLFSVYERVVASLVPELNRLRAARVEAESKLDQQRESARKERRELEDQISQLRTEKGRIENEKIEQAKQSDGERRRLLDEKEEVQKTLARAQEDLFVTDAKLRSMILQLEERIQQMKDKRERSLADTDADGEIVHADFRLGQAWIDVGLKDRLRRGTTFEVFQFVKGGKRKIKGMIEVKQVEDDYAVVAVIQERDPTDPIIKGDYIASPFFDRKKEMVFVFVGDGLTNQRYERSQLVRRIQDFGGRVDDNVSIDTDFVVAIKNAEQSPEFQKAVQFGTVIMRESELIEFIGQ